MSLAVVMNRLGRERFDMYMSTASSEGQTWVPVTIDGRQELRLGSTSAARFWWDGSI